MNFVKSKCQKSTFIQQALQVKESGESVGNLIARATELPIECFTDKGIDVAKAKKFFRSRKVVTRTEHEYKQYDGSKTGAKVSRHYPTR